MTTTAARGLASARFVASPLSRHPRRGLGGAPLARRAAAPGRRDRLPAGGAEPPGDAGASGAAPRRLGDLPAVRHRPGLGAARPDRHRRRRPRPDRRQRPHQDAAAARDQRGQARARQGRRHRGTPARCSSSWTPPTPSADGASLREQLRAADAPRRSARRALDARRCAATARPILVEPEPGGDRRVDHADPPPRPPQLQAEWQRHHGQAGQARRRAGAAAGRDRAPCASSSAKLRGDPADRPRTREADFRSLTEQGFMSAHAGQDRTRERIEQERDLATQRARLAEAQAALNEAGSSRAAPTSPKPSACCSDRARPGRPQAPAAAPGARARASSARACTQLDRAGGRHGAAGGGAHRGRRGHAGPGADGHRAEGCARSTAEVVVDNKDIGFVNAGDSGRRSSSRPFRSPATARSTPG